MAEPAGKAHRAECGSSSSVAAATAGATLSQPVADAAALSVLAIQRAMPASLKPGENESTVLAGFVAIPRAGTRAPVCLAAAAGTRCVGYKKDMTPCRRALTSFDCHAEVLARRQLIVWLLLDALRRQRDPDHTPAVDIAASDIYLVVSRSPCGDCSVGEAPRAAELSPVAAGRLVTGGRKVVRASTANGDKQPYQDEAHGYLVSRHMNGHDDVDEGVVRVKPGKGIPALCMSCSDKIAKWVAVGLVPPKLRGVLPDLQLRGVIMCDARASLSSVRRGVFGRIAELAPGRVAPLVVEASDEVTGLFEAAVSRPTAEHACPRAVAWRQGPRATAHCEKPLAGGWQHALNTKSGLPQGLTEIAVDILRDDALKFVWDAKSGCVAGMKAASPSSAALRAVLAALVAAPPPSGAAAGGKIVQRYAEIGGDSEAVKVAREAREKLLHRPPFDEWVIKPRPDFQFELKL